VTAFVVKQQHVLSQQFSLSDVRDQQLAFWISQRYLDAATEKLLRKVVDLRQTAAGIEAQIGRLEKERDGIHAEQKRIRENLGSLGDRPSEKDLRERFVRTLNSQEDRLEAINRELRQRHDEREKVREEIGTLLAGLEYEAKV
jgi:predicted  nucleic acid-binding Zn-ribbon protein